MTKPKPIIQPKPAAPSYTMMRPPLPLPNYTLSTVCPACNAPTVRRACKVRCERCGFMWDCSEL
ncbi:MAG: hypothetical protein ABI970_02660 [Chloroflexota bacterium]